ncbi:MAG: F0F1 ATP synthase subunit delta [Anaerolineae bacterium]|nr:F0F1 ATP synthase subunit delta [Anaerolineae bacterium]
MLELNLSTILLQMANFLVLVYILARFLFKPLQAMLERRAQETTRQLSEAETTLRQAESLRQDYEQKQENLDAEIAARKNEVRIVAEQTRQQMLQEVQIQLETLQTQTEKALEHLRREARQQHREEIGALAARLVEQTISDIITPEIQTAYQEKFLEQLRSIGLATHIDTTDHESEMVAEVTTATELPDAYRARLAATLDAATSRPITLTYRMDPVLIAGVVLRLEDIRIDGSVHGQIQQLQKRYQDQLT